MKRKENNCNGRAQASLSAHDVQKFNHQFQWLHKDTLNWGICLHTRGLTQTTDLKINVVRGETLKNSTEQGSQGVKGGGDLQSPITVNSVPI